jgi:hypothetical protein
VIAKGNAAYRGRKRALTLEQVAEIRSRASSQSGTLIKSHTESRTALAKELGVNRETFYQALRALTTPLPADNPTHGAILPLFEGPLDKELRK